MSKKDIIDYVMETPGNTNKKVLGRLIDEVEGVKLPEVTEDDNGSVLTVVDGVWNKAEPSGGSGAGVFMVEYGTRGNTTIRELKATWQEIYDAHASGKLVITYTGWAGPPDLGVIMDERYLVDGIAYLPGESRPYRVHFNDTWYRCESPDERPDTSNN